MTRAWVFPLLIVPMVLLGTPTLCLADRLDTALFAESRRILQFLQKRDVKNVGVLKFRIKRGNEPLSFHTSDLNLNLARRLENALVLVDPSENPIGIIHDASAQALKKGSQVNYLNLQGRQNLFRYDYDLAWGTDKVKADVFLTGYVTVTPELRYTIVVVEAYFKHAEKPEKVAELRVPTDRSMLADLGYAFHVSRSLEDRDAAEQEEAALTSAARAEQGRKPPSGEERITIQILYNGKPQTSLRDRLVLGEEQLAPPTPDQRVTLQLKNVSKETLGVVVKVDGRNSLYEQEEQLDRCSRWVLKPSETFELKGYWADERFARPFRSISTELLENRHVFDGPLGLIQIAVFCSGHRSASKPANFLSLRDGDLRSKQPKPRSLVELQRRLRERVQPRAMRALIAKSEGSSKVDALTSVGLENPVFVEHRVWRYTLPEKSSNGSGTGR